MRKGEIMGFTKKKAKSSAKKDAVQGNEESMNYYLIDYENVKAHGLDGLNKLKENSTVCIFYSKNADSLPFELHRELSRTKANIVYLDVTVGTKNALDFQLATYLGYIICENKTKRNNNYFIVTKDNGFSSLVSYWTSKKYKVMLAADCTGKKEKEETSKSPEEIAKLRLLHEVEQVVDDKAIAPTVVRFIQHCKTKQEINNALMKKLKDSKKSSEIYNAIKPLITEKKGK